MSSATQSAVIVEILAAEGAVAEHRAQLDRAAGWGVPAHVTVLHPFMSPSDVDGSVMEALGAAVASVSTFEVTFRTTGWFGTDVLWLDPEPSNGFTALTRAVTNAFPDYQPYGGQHGAVIPHLTVGHDAPVARLREAERQVLAHLPIRSDVRAASLWCGTDAPATWRKTAVLPLG